MNYDVIVVGAGPAGLAAALGLAARGSLRICLLEKAARIGGHLLSGALLDPNDLAALVPDWPDRNPPLGPCVTRDTLHLFTPRDAFPLPRLWDNSGCRLVSLGALCRWLAGLAEEAGVEIYPGFAATGLLWEQNRLAGVRTGDQGRASNGLPKPGFQPGIPIRAPVTILAEGCRGYLTRQAIQHLSLDAGRPPQTYALGFKELWETPPDPAHPPGEVLHALGWPLDAQTHGGGFLYRLAPERTAVGWIVGLDYRNPRFDPLVAFQTWKTHPVIRSRLRGGRLLGYGARTLVEGGWQALPRLTFAGGVLVGDGAGFLDTARLKGIGNAMRSGLAAASAVLAAFGQGDFSRAGLQGYPQAVQDAPWGRALRAVRNIRPGFRNGRLPGLLNAGWERWTNGRSPWTLQWHTPDRSRLQEAGDSLPRPDPRADGRLTFDRPALLARSALTHRADQPVHLRLLDPKLPLEQGRVLYANPETRYCPAGVYQLTSQAGFVIQAGNCLHCKCCDIKDPHDNIRWTPPEGGSGPDYGEM
ncbi:MAG: electron transfer flavoprotein-ubiquinone oxidoreductase [Magnetococcales bacterium]|nr:electron transfer flavoprotein-ubiquinone oxidoreductase [Magnetococcales bacterium]